jgi:hypothetical protein
LRPLAVKIAGFYSRSLEAPTLALRAEVPTQPVADSSPVTINIIAANGGKAAPRTLVEMEIWDASNKVVYKEHKSDQNFAPGEKKSLTFSWTPTHPGVFSVSVAAFGPAWVLNYAWAEKIAAITVK